MLNLPGLLTHWDDVSQQPCLAEMLACKESARARRGLGRRLRRAWPGTFDPLADFDWSWPETIDRPQVEELFRFEWLAHSRPCGLRRLGCRLVARHEELMHCTDDASFVSL